MVCGVCTDICVLHTVADARNHDYQVEVPVDCVASFDLAAHEFALRHMEGILGAKLAGSPQPQLAVPQFEVPASILSGDTTDIYLLRTVDILKREGINPVATMEVFPGRAGILCGMHEVHALLSRVLPEGNREVWSLSEGDSFQSREVVIRIKAPF